MINSLKDYREVQHCYYDVKDNIEKINEYQLEIKRVFDKIFDISSSDVYAAEELFNGLSSELQLLFLRTYGYKWLSAYSKRSDEDLQMIEKYDPERAKRLKK